MIDISKIVENARKAQTAWADLSLAKRLELMRDISKIFKASKDKIAELSTKEMGMPIDEAQADVDSGLDYLNWYIDNAEKFLSPEVTFESDKEIHKIFYEPKGVVASIIPWNFPFSNVIWQGFQNLIVGNAVIMKHSEYVPNTSKFIADLMAKSKLPKDVFTMIFGDGEAGKKLAAQDINMICFTGSTKVGEYLYKQAAEKFIPCLMELGGSAAGIVFADADIDSTVENIFANRFYNAGQVCDGLKRLIVHESIFDIVVEKLVNFCKSKSDQVGALVSKKQLQLAIDQLDDAKQKGAKIICGGNLPTPTILINVSNDMRVWNQETFAPILPIVKFKTFDQAIKLANDTEYGLGGYIYTTCNETFEKAARLLKTGMVAMNGLTYLLPQNPFGGYKKSGLGRSHGRHGFHELCNIKVVAFEK